MATKTEVELVVKLDDKASRQLKDIDKALSSLNGRMGGLTTSSGAAAGALGGFSSKLSAAKIGVVAVAAGTVALTKAIMDNARAYESVTQQLNILEGDTEKYKRTLTGIAKETRSDFGAVVDLFTKLKVTTADLGFTTEQVEELTRKFSKALVVAGADAQTSAGVIRQFGQAMASGSVRGDEFVSINEGLGMSLAILAKESGRTIGDLREMSQAGELTAKVFADMLLNSTELDRKFELLEPTMDQLNQQLGNSIQRLSFAVAQFLGLDAAAKALAISITKVADAISDAATGPTALEVLEEQLIVAKAELIAIPKEITKVRDAVVGMEHTFDGAADTIERYVTKLEEQNVTFKETNPAYAAQEALIKSLEEQIATLKKTTEEATSTQQENTRTNEQHNKELLETIFNYGKILDPLKERKSEEEKLQEQLDKTVYALYLYNRAFGEGINRLGAGSQATRHMLEETGLLSDEIDRLTKELEELREAAAIAENPYLGLIKQHRDLQSEALTLTAQMAEVALQMQDSEDKTGELAFAYASLKEQLAQVNAELNQFAPMTVETLDKQIQKTLEVEEANKRLLEEYIKQGASVAELAEAYRILGLEVPEVLQSYDDYVESMEEAAKVTNNNISNQRQYMKVLQAQKAATDDLTEAQEKQLKTLESMFETTKEGGFDLAETIEKTLSQTISGISGAMADMLLGLGNGFSSLEDIALNAVRNIIAALIEAQIQKMILGNGMGGIGGIGSMFAGVGMSSMIPGIGIALGIGGLLGGLFADGGNVPSGRKPIVVGERGPELFLPGRSGQVVSNEQLNTMNGGGGDLSVTFNINAIDTQTGTEFIVENKRVITGVIQDAYRRRGAQGPLG